MAGNYGETFQVEGVLFYCLITQTLHLWSLLSSVETGVGFCGAVAGVAGGEMAGALVGRGWGAIRGRKLVIIRPWCVLTVQVLATHRTCPMLHKHTLKCDVLTHGHCTDINKPRSPYTDSKKQTASQVRFKNCIQKKSSHTVCTKSNLKQPLMIISAFHFYSSLFNVCLLVILSLLWKCWWNFEKHSANLWSQCNGPEWTVSCWVQ